MTRRKIVSSLAGLTGAAITLSLVSILLFSHNALQPRGAIGSAASAAATDSLLPSDPTPTPVALQPSPTPPPQVATINNPLPSPTPQSGQPSPSPVSVPAPSPTPTSLPTPQPTPVTSPSPLPSSTPPPPPPPPPSVTCRWAVDVSTLSSPATSTWTDLGTWNGSGTIPSSPPSSPIFIMAGTGWMSYTYAFSDGCIGHANLASTTISGAPIHSDNIISSPQQTEQANLPPNTEVVFVVTLS